ncbi:MAG: response regulator transcription factor [Desulfuromonadales bacterium]|nr:response regulator transcription factor [Desulfuromonadales bacterium]NIR33711.1 response regulator transcription factor [Desulfuromonadales bacterium]NIS44033.1 response regulator transcription factor [Desulfuromonadales bacterium]
MSDSPHILLVEDEEHIARGLVFNLEEEGYRVTHVLSGEEALEMAEEEKRLSLVILDLMLPGIDGFEVCERLRQSDPQLPILMLTARTEEKDRVEGLLTGADDYLTKPFSLDELMLRVKGMLRRSSWYRPERAGEQSFRFGGNEVDLEERTAATPRGEIELTELEARMLRTFFSHEGKTLSRQAILSAVWGVKPDTETRTLDNFIVRLRRYFEEDPGNPRHFLTVRGKGYRFVQNP